MSEKTKKGEKKLRCKLEYSKQESLNFEIKSFFILYLMTEKSFHYF